MLGHIIVQLCLLCGSSFGGFVALFFIFSLCFYSLFWSYEEGDCITWV